MRELGPLGFLFRLAYKYFLDWAVIVGTVAFAGSTSLWAVPSTRPFDPSSASISYPFQTRTKIPTWLLVLLAVILPGILIALLTLFSPRSGAGWRARIYSLNTAWLGLGLSIATAMLVTDGLKNLCGRPRPDLLARCSVDSTLLNSYTIGPRSLVTWDVCRTKQIAGNKALGSDDGALNEGDLRDGFRSFPSGHASMSFAGLLYFAIFMAEYVFHLPLPHLSAPLSAPIVDGSGSGTPSRRSSRRSTRRVQMLPRYPIMLAILLCGVPVLLAIYIASTRYSDYRHHPGDIFGGAALGAVAAAVAWRFYGAWCCVADAGMYGVDTRPRRRKRLRGGEGAALEEGDTEGEGVEMRGFAEGGSGSAGKRVSREGSGSGGAGRR
ncbi:phosphatidic acid phosphatase type 2/haloperoxidase [Geopyxis carbonaria]|nr:phosphatidic acid phosphatase type 2/haloperoxidase [Geopyxis carbonaria]